MVKTEERLLILPDFVFILKAFESGEKTLTDLQEDIKMTYSHLYYLKNKMLEYSWIKTRQEGVMKHLSLTDKGREILEAVNNLIDKMNLDKNNLIQYRRSGKYKKKTKNDEVETNESI